jgi:hypothetical protein
MLVNQIRCRSSKSTLLLLTVHLIMKHQMYYLSDIEVTRIARQILKYTCPIYIFKTENTEKPTYHGCAVLITHNNNYFALSNAHVIADNFLNRTRFHSGIGEFKSLSGQTYFTKMPPSNRRIDDTLDIGIIHLENETAQTLLAVGSLFLDANYLISGHAATPGEYILIAGYPYSQFRLDFKNHKIKPTPFILKSSLFLKDCSHINFPPNLHFVLKYSRNKILNYRDKKRKGGPHPKGMSGSGLWLLKKGADGEFRPYLIGISSEYLENRALIVSTKIDLFADIIRKKVDPFFPNNGVGVRIHEYANH